MAMEDLIYVGFNSRVAALNRDTGEIVWSWRSPKGTGYTTVLLDGDRLIVSVIGYTYCLHPETGQVLWFNELPGFGAGVASLASVRGTAPCTAEAASADEDARRASDSTTHTSV
jgi:outer membrane protein assembly factor BamB